MSGAPHPYDGTLDKLLLEFLSRAGALPPQILEFCTSQARAETGSLGEALLAGGYLESAELEQAYAQLPASSTGPLHLGEVLATSYRVEGLLGQGGMGAVYRVLELQGRRSLALKVILPSSAEELDLLRFQREAEVAARLSQAGGFVRVHSGGTHRGLPYFVMDLVDGQDLQSALEAGLEPEELAQVLSVVAEGLQACHEAGLVHRDLKPANVLLGSEGPKVADLGLVRDRDAQTLTQTGEILGTPAYMAPEQVIDARSVDARTDVYALGAILYRGLAGQAPFSGTLLQVLDHIVSRDPPRPRSLNPAAPPALEQVCLRAMAKDPGRRYASAKDFSADIRAALGGERLADRPSRGPSGLLLLAGVSAIAGALALVAWAGRDAGLGAPGTPSARSADPRDEARARLRRGYEELLDPSVKRRVGTAKRVALDLAERAARAGLTTEEVSAIKHDRWRAAQPAWRTRLEELARQPKGAPAVAFAVLGVALSTEPGVREGLAEITSGTFAILLEESGSRRAIRLQMERRLLDLDPPQALKEAVSRRYREEPRGTVLDCLRVDVPLTINLATSRNRVRLDLRGSDHYKGLPPGQLRGYVEILLEFGRRTLPTTPGADTIDYLARIAERIEGVLKLPRDLGRRANHELQWQRLKAIALRGGLILREPELSEEAKEAVRAELARVPRECWALMDRARGSLVDELAEVACIACEHSGDPAGTRKSWERAARILEKQCQNPPFGECPQHSLGKALRNLAVQHQRAGEHAQAIETIREVIDLLPAISARLTEVDLPTTEEFRERYLGEAALVGIESCVEVGKLELGERFLAGCLTTNRMEQQPLLGERAVLLALRRGDLAAAKARIELMEEARVEPKWTEPLWEKLAAERGR